MTSLLAVALSATIAYGATLALFAIIIAISGPKDPPR